MKERLKWIDVAKGICIISVMAGHLGVRQINAVVFAYHLAVFFILSGYTMKDTKSGREILNKKFCSLMIPYFITCFGVMLMDIINSIVVYKNTSNEIITHIISRDLIRAFFASGSITKFGSIQLESRIGAIWFLPALFFAGIFARLIINNVNDKRMKYIVALVLALTGNISAEFVWLPFSIQAAMYSTFFVILGYDLRQSDCIEKINLRHIILPAVFFAVMVVADKARINFVTASSSMLLLSELCGIGASLVIIYISKKLEFVKPLQWAGKYSLYILCVHLFELETMYPYFEKVFKLLHIRMWELPLFIVKLIFVFGVTAVIVKINVTVQSQPRKLAFFRCGVSAKYIFTVKRSRMRAFITFNCKNMLGSEQLQIKKATAKNTAIGIDAVAEENIITERNNVPEEKTITERNIESRIKKAGSRDIGLDFGKGILIILMMLGHFDIDKDFRNIIYSFHMMAFVAFSGYYFKPEAAEKLKHSIWRLIKAFIFPYLVFSFFYVMINNGDKLHYILNAIFGLSFSGRYFNKYESIGPVYFVLMLFVVRLMYLLMCRLVKSEEQRHISVIMISMAGVVAGKKGIWLPWSIDCAMYAIVFYHIGYCLRRYQIMNYIYDRMYWYFVLVTIWAYMIYDGGMELAIRNYGNYGLTILGAVSATILLYGVSKYIVDNGNIYINQIIAYIGKSTLYILMIHTLLRKYISMEVNRYFTKGYIFNMIIMIIIQIFAGVAVTCIIEKVKRLIRRNLDKNYL